MSAGAAVAGVCVAVAFVVVVAGLFYRIRVVDKRAREERLMTKADAEFGSGAADGIEPEKNCAIFTGGALAEMEEEGPEAWYFDVDPPSPETRKSISAGQDFIRMPVLGIAHANYPLPLQQQSAFSIKFVSGVQGTVAVGLSWKPGVPNALPGHFVRSVGLQSDGFVYSGQSDVWRGTFDGSFKDGDTITVLVDRSRGSVRWLKNGKFVIDAQQMTNDIPVTMLLPALRLEKGWPNNVAIFPALGFQGAAVVEVSFGKEGKPFKGLEEYGDDLVFGRGDSPAGLEEELNAARANAESPSSKSDAKGGRKAAIRLFKRSSTMPTTPSESGKVEESSPSKVAESKVNVRYAQMRALRMTHRSKRMAVSESSDRLEDRFQEALQRNGIDRTEYLSQESSGVIQSKAVIQDARESRLRDAGKALDVKAKRCRFKDCQCTELVLPKLGIGETYEYSSLRCTGCGHALSYHRQLPGRRFTSIGDIDDGLDRACELFSYSKAHSGPRWRRVTDMTGEDSGPMAQGRTVHYNIDTGEILDSECPDVHLNATIECTRPNAARVQRIISEGRMERPKRERPIETWYIKEKIAAENASLNSKKRGALLGRDKLQEVRDAVALSSSLGAMSPKKKLGGFGKAATEPVGQSHAMPLETGLSSSSRDEVEAIKAMSESIMSKLPKTTSVKAIAAPIDESQELQDSEGSPDDSPV